MKNKKYSKIQINLIKKKDKKKKSLWQKKAIRIKLFKTYKFSRNIKYRSLVK